MKVGFIGLGTMGRHMAANIQLAGYDLMVHDVRAEAAESHLAAGASWGESPAAVMDTSEVTFTSLPTPADVEQVTLGPGGLIESLAANKAFFDLSTNAVSTIRKIQTIFAAQDTQVCDAPVSGGPDGARSRKLAMYVGGEQATFENHRTLLETMSDQLIYVGPIGSGTVAKLVHNCVGYMINLSIAEVFTIGVRSGVEPLALWKAIRQGAVGRRRTFDSLGAQFLPNEFSPPAFKLSLAHKDVGLATALGRELGVPMRLAEMTLAEMTEALGRGWGDLDSRVAMTLQTERAGVHLAVAREDIAEELQN